MLKTFLTIFEPFVLMLLGTVLLASVLPPRGPFVPLFDVATIRRMIDHWTRLLEGVAKSDGSGPDANLRARSSSYVAKLTKNRAISAAARRRTGWTRISPLWGKRRASIFPPRSRTVSP